MMPNTSGLCVHAAHDPPTLRPDPPRYVSFERAAA
jgi:hypothetical protein